MYHFARLGTDFEFEFEKARNACPGWGAVPFIHRKAILAGLLNKMDDYTDELSALLSVEQGVTPAEARWEIDLLTRAFGPALMQMEANHKDLHLNQATRHPALLQAQFLPAFPCRYISTPVSRRASLSRAMSRC